MFGQFSTLPECAKIICKGKLDFNELCLNVAKAKKIGTVSNTPAGCLEFVPGLGTRHQFPSAARLYRHG